MSPPSGSCKRKVQCIMRSGSLYCCFGANVRKLHRLKLPTHAKTSPASSSTALKLRMPPLVPEGTQLPGPGGSLSAKLPAHCRVDGMMHRRKGVGGEEFGIGFRWLLPEAQAWNGDMMMQGGGGSNGVINYPAGAQYAGSPIRPCPRIRRRQHRHRTQGEKRRFRLFVPQRPAGLSRFCVSGQR